MEDDSKAIVSTKQPEKEVDDRTLVVATEPGTVVEEESAGELPEEAPAVSKKGKKKRSKKLRCCTWCCGLAAVIFLLLAIILIILIFTIFKVKNPIIKVTSITLQSVNLHIPTFLDTNFTVAAEIYTNATVHNPNAGEFKYGSTTAQIFYHGEQVGVAPVAAGEVKARNSEDIFLPLQLTLSSNDLMNGNLTKDLIDDQMLPLVSKLYTKGTVEFGFIKIHNVRVSSECDINYYLNQTQKYSLHCQYNTKI